MRLLYLFLFCLLAPSATSAPTLSDEQVTAFARLALDGIQREYPNKPSNILQNKAGIRSPSQMHPAFYGSYDWHSSIHGHWMLARLLRLYPDSSIAKEIQTLLDKQLTKEKMETEVAYFREKGNKSFERMYGWAWALQLAAELHQWKQEKKGDGKSPHPARWSEAFAPLEKEIVALIHDYLPRLTWPIRTGTHQDTAFALGMSLDYARTVGNEKLAALIIERAKYYYQKDTNYPVAYEPSGHDFFSSGLNEADLMRRILPQEEFPKWLDSFFPTLKKDKTLGNLLIPATVSDVTDGHLIHLAGLNFNRAWTMSGITNALPKDDSRRGILETATLAHLKYGLNSVFTGHYEGEHWLATFAIYSLTQAKNP